MLGGGKLSHPTSKCVQSSLCEPNPVLRRTAAAVRAPLRRRPRYILHMYPDVYVCIYIYMYIQIQILYVYIYIYDIWVCLKMRYTCRIAVSMEKNCNPP